MKKEKETILIVDDEEDIIDVIQFNLEREGYNVNSVTTGEECIEEIELRKPDLIILDLMLPGISGIDVCKRLKYETETKNIPIIMLTAKDSELDIVIGLEFGADDYMTKPFSPKVLTAKIKAILRRSISADIESETIERQGIFMNFTKHQVKCDNKDLNLTFSEFAILKLLIRKPGRVFSRQQIVNSTKEHEYVITERAIDVQIVGLRKKLGDLGDLIKTVRGVGYKFNE